MTCTKGLAVSTLFLLLSLFIGFSSDLYSHFQPEFHVAPAAKREMKLLKLLYSNSSGERGTTVFDSGRKTYSSLWYLDNGKRNSIAFYEYNKKGKLVRKKRKFSDKKTSVQNFKYDNKGRLIYEDFSRSDGKSGNVRYNYSGDVLVSAVCNGLNGWFKGMVNFSYDKQSKIKSAVLLSGSKRIGSIIYTYRDNLLAREKWLLGKKFTQTFEYVYEKRNEGCTLANTSANGFIVPVKDFRIKSENYSFSGKSKGPSEFFYRENKLFKKIFTRSDGLKTLTYFFYNSENILLHSLRIYSDGKSGIFTYKYSKKRKLLERNLIRTDGLRASEKYVYNSRDELIKAEWVNFDSWLTGDIAFKSDDKGLITKGKFTGKGKKKFLADISFVYDEFRNLTEIFWEFSFNGTQKYRFLYENI